MTVLQASSKLRRLTQRQRQIVTHIARGQCRKQIGVELGISIRTIDFHLHTKGNNQATHQLLGFSDPARLAHFAILAGLVKLGETDPS